jgi:nicotinate-nucleotide pyrophosphorylase (carboxylating)
MRNVQTEIRVMPQLQGVSGRGVLCSTSALACGNAGIAQNATEGGCATRPVTEALQVRRIVRQALAEDIGPGDITSESLIPAKSRGRAFIVSRAPGVVAGIPVAREVFRQVSPRVSFRTLARDGQRVRAGQRIAEVKGPVRALLAGERVALNFLQRMSGIATLTRRCVDAVRGHDVRILDTRKTTPVLRLLEKYAVRMGGGSNHRMGLYDQVLIKDNHLEALLPEAGSLPEAVRLAVLRARAHVRRDIRVEVEAESLDMVAAGIEARADIIMLDNMSVAGMRKACRLVRAHRRKHGCSWPITEASGSLTLNKLAAVAATGVDSISLGALTHSAPVLDVAMDME